MNHERYAFVLTTSREYWDRLRQCGAKNSVTLSFVRKGQVGPKRTKKLIFYIKKPIMQIRGSADFVDHLKGRREEMWIRYGKESCFESVEEYDSFLEKRDKATFIRFNNLAELNEPKTAEEISSIVGSLRGFRGGYVDFDIARKLIT